ncbi:hypothetical protein [Pedobacter cryoconitis]|uniref:hypothetical protein n=1 Tax=Pedobacter cryoconitis TaxID=188932 RepID=UPI001610FA96|nr:hypothetical protein [Pedobacter cryoconitis]MBB5644715.1 hypothetical protein [Pedobacter cryoconitis]
MAAYNDLIAEDWVESEERKGYRVPSRLPFDQLDHIPALPKISPGYQLIVDDGFPETDIFPIEKILKEYRKLLGFNILKKSASVGI